MSVPRVFAMIAAVAALAAPVVALAGPPAPVMDGSGRVGVWEPAPRPAVSAVAAQTRRAGWPHRATLAEARGVAYRVARHEVAPAPGQAAVVLCRPVRRHAGFFLCGVRVWDPGFDADGRVWSYPLVVTVGPSGAWDTSIPGDRYLRSGSRVVGAAEVPCRDACKR